MPTSAAENFNLAWHCLGRQAAEHGGKTAVIIVDGPDAFRSWTYAELDGMVRRKTMPRIAIDPTFAATLPLAA